MSWQGAGLHPYREALQTVNGTLKTTVKEKTSLLRVNVTKNLNLSVLQESETLRTLRHMVEVKEICMSDSSAKINT